MRCRVVTPNELVYDGELLALIIPGDNGELGILNDHAPMITLIKEGRVEMRLENKLTRKFRIGNGFAEVRDNRVMIFTDRIMPPEDK